MKLKYLLLLSCFSSFLAAQINLPAQLTEETNTVTIPSSQSLPHSAPETVIWSEDFANGIPSSWSQVGTPALAVWEYRGPSTVPNNTVGARGAFSGVNNNPPTNVPLNSSSAANGFLIFDSGYLDNAGNTSLGNGVAPSPHIGKLFTDTIDLSSDPNVTINFQSFARRFQAQFFVAFSIDGGLTYSDTIEVYPIISVPVNGGTLNGINTSINVSNIIGGQSMVKMQFIFDGTPGNANGNGYYHWMLDDLELVSTSSYSFAIAPSGFAPAQDIIYNNDVSYPKYGIISNNQLVPIQADMNIVNDGSATQNNVKLNVEVLDLANGQVVHTMQSISGCGTLLPGDTCDFVQTLTAQWTPPVAAANYALVYKAISDSMTLINAYVSTDTFYVSVSDTAYALHAGLIDNFVGTNSATNDIIAVGSLFNLNNEDPDSAGSNLVFIDGAYLNISALTDSTADLSFSIFDTAGFAFNNGFPAGTTPLYTKNFTLNSSLIGQNSFFDFSSNGQPLSLGTGTYLLIVNFFPNATSGEVRLANQASPRQQGTSVVMQLGDGNWFGGFTSTALESPHITLNLAQLNCLTQRDTLNLSACFNGSITSPSGRFTYLQNGVYFDTAQTSSACETYYVINANFLARAADSLQVQVCDTSYTSPSGIIYSQSGFYQDTISNSLGCDSIISIQLDIKQSVVSSDTLVIDTCARSIISPAGNTLSSTGFYTETLVAANGCDSIIFIDLSINPLNLSLTSIINGTGLVVNQVNAQYQWFDCATGLHLPGDTNQIFTPSQNGTYAVIISKEACVDTSACIIIASIGLPSLANFNFDLYPNPSSGIVMLEIPEELSSSRIEIYNFQGALLHSEQLVNEKTKTITTNLAKGAYLLRLVNKSGSKGEKILMME